MMLAEVDELNKRDAETKISYLKDRIDNALSTLDSIPKTILNSQKNSDYYKLLKNINKVLQ